MLDALHILSIRGGESDVEGQSTGTTLTDQKHSPGLGACQCLKHLLTKYSISDSDVPLGRMLGALRFWFTKDLVRRTSYTYERNGTDGS